MSTRSIIGLKEHGGDIRYIYCHSDGYPEYNGRILKKHYTDEEKVKDLINLGDISVLDEHIGSKQDFNNRTRGWTLAYGRDRGETGVKAKLSTPQSLGWNAGRCGAEYAYVFEDGKWKSYAVHTDKLESLDGKKKATKIEAFA